MTDHRVAPTSTPAAPDQAPPPWHARRVDLALSHLDSHIDGLTADEAAHRLATHGPNSIPPPKARGPLMRFLAQFNNLLILVLIGAAVITALMGHWLDTGVILAVVILNAVIGFIQEGKAERALNAIRHMLAPRATVLRDGSKHDIAAEDLVPGDVVLLASGDKVPADLRLLQVRNLRVDESALTGESVPVEKQVEAVGADAAIGDRACMAYSGTLVAYGQARGLVVATGTQTELGRIGRMLEDVQELVTPLLRKIAGLARWLTVAILVLASATFAFGMLVHGYGAAEMFIAAVGLAVAGIPEGLPAIMTVTLAIGVQRMASRHAVIRRLPAVETLGAVTVICSDKTGTLTRNEMTVQQVVLAGATVEVDGAGYAPDGNLSIDGRALPVADLPVDLLHLLQAGLLCNDATLRKHDDGWQITGDPTEAALITLATKAGLEQAACTRDAPRIDTIPFESEHRYMGTLHRMDDGAPWLALKGAPERVLQMCATQQEDGQAQPLNLAHWQASIDAQARAGRRVLALAGRRLPQGQQTVDHAHVQEGLTLLGLVGIIDPPRQEAIEAVAHCREAGIRVKMITGDHGVTASAIAKQLGLGGAQAALTGPEIEEMDDDALRRAVQAVDVFARASPEHKLRLVQALQHHGEIVAMTGDGVNDAPALKQADVGIAMGMKGTEAAKQAGEMVLADDNFSSIAHAVEEGRTVYDNLRKTVTFLLPINGGESMALLVAVLLGVALPILPAQILWVNMVSSIALAMVLAFEPTEPDVMKRPPRPVNEPLMTGFVIWRVVLVSVLFLIGIFGMYELALMRGEDIETARTIAVNTLVAMEVFYLFSVRYLKSPSFTWQGVKGTPLVLLAVGSAFALQMVFTYVPFMHTLFQTRALSFETGLQIVAVGVALLLTLEVEKWLRRRLMPGAGDSHAGPAAGAASPR